MQEELQQETAECARLQKVVDDLRQQVAQVQEAARLEREFAEERARPAAQADEGHPGAASLQQQPEQAREATCSPGREAGEAHAQPQALGDEGDPGVQQQPRQEAASRLKRAPAGDSAWLRAQADTKGAPAFSVQHQLAQAGLVAEMLTQDLEAQKVRVCLRADPNLLQRLPAWKCPEQCTCLVLMWHPAAHAGTCVRACAGRRHPLAPASALRDHAWHL